MRVLLAKRLRREGYSQLRIAQLLGVSQPAVKNYLSEDEEEVLRKLEGYGISRDEVEGYVDELVRVITAHDVPSAMSYVTRWSLRVLSSLKLCDFHRAVDPEVPKSCDVCKLLYVKDELQELNDAAALLSNELITPLIPEVLSNLAYAKENAETINDVAAFEGRITKVRGVPTPASGPAWGASVHLAKVLLKVMKRDRMTRAVMNVRYDEVIMRTVRALGLTFAVAGPQDWASDDEIADAVYRAFSPGTEVVFHLGGKGLEPVTYVFGPNPIAVIKKVLEIGRKYRELIESEKAENNTKSSL
ncbi:MAG: transcriptional regulator [Sulfolobales archaeon]|nr:transcriptional regulator [Sulfolobales archaeon]